MFIKTIKRLLAANVLVLMLLGTSTAALGQRRDWEPQRTWVFVVGTLRFKHKDMFDSFPQKNRRDTQLVQFFKQQGVPATQIVYLRDAEATQAGIQRALAAQLARARKGDWLFLYYTGHGYKSDEGETYLASYDAGDEGVMGWEVNSIPLTIERYFKGSSAFIALDNCYSGTLVEAITRRAGRVSYAAFSSSPADKSSTGEWTFTEGLLASLRGRASEDMNNDGQITIGELASQLKEDMSFAENQRAVFTVTGDFNQQTVLSQAEAKRDPRIGERVMVRSEGSWYRGRIIDVDAETSQFLIHYYGWDDSYDEWVGAKQIRRPGMRRDPVNRSRDVESRRQWISP